MYNTGRSKSPMAMSNGAAFFRGLFIALFKDLAHEPRGSCYRPY